MRAFDLAVARDSGVVLRGNQSAQACFRGGSLQELPVGNVSGVGDLASGCVYACLA